VAVPNELSRAFAAATAATATPTTAAAASTRPPRTLPYSVIVHSYSSVSLRAELQQSGFEPGARVRVDATVSQSGATVTAVNASYNGLIAPGNAVNFGIGGTWHASDAPPTAFRLNGGTCTTA